MTTHCHLALLFCRCLSSWLPCSPPSSPCWPMVGRLLVHLPILLKPGLKVSHWVPIPLWGGWDRRLGKREPWLGQPDVCSDHSERAPQEIRAEALRRLWPLWLVTENSMLQLEASSDSQTKPWVPVLSSWDRNGCGSSLSEVEGYVDSPYMLASGHRR